MANLEKTESVFKKIIYRFFYPSCVYFALSVLLVTLFARLLLSMESLSLKSLIFVYAFSLCLAGCNQIFYINKLPGALKVILHWLSLIVLFIVMFVVSLNNVANPIGAVIVLILVSIVYYFFYLIKWLLTLFIPTVVFRRWLYPLTMYFLLGVTVNEILCYVVQVSDSAPTLKNLGFIGIFAVIMMIAHQIFYSKISIFFKIAIHFLAYIAGTIACLVILTHNYKDYSDAFIPCIVIAVVYLLVASIVTLIVSKKRKTDNNNEKYSKQFS